MNKTIYTDNQRYLVRQLKKARFDIGLTQNGVAKLLNKTQSYISKIESGQQGIDVFQLKAFSDVYKKEIDFFIK